MDSWAFSILNRTVPAGTVALNVAKSSTVVLKMEKSSTVAPKVAKSSTLVLKMEKAQESTLPQYCST